MTRVSPTNLHIKPQIKVLQLIYITPSDYPINS